MYTATGAPLTHVNLVEFENAFQQIDALIHGDLRALLLRFLHSLHHVLGITLRSTRLALTAGTAVGAGGETEGADPAAHERAARRLVRLVAPPARGQFAPASAAVVPVVHVAAFRAGEAAFAERTTRQEATAVGHDADAVVDLDHPERKRKVG